MYIMTTRQLNGLPETGVGRDQSDDQSLVDKWEETRDVQLTLPPPPKHCPICTAVVRSPSAALGLETYSRMVREPGARWFGKLMGRVCARSLYVVGPASSKRIRRFLSAAARRPAMTQAAVPPVHNRTSKQLAEGRRAGNIGS